GTGGAPIRLVWASTRASRAPFARPRSSICSDPFGAVGATNMEARQIIDGASFGPEALKAIGQAFDDAWASMAPKVGSDPLRVQAARLNLANVILSIATEGSRDPDRLKEAALRAMHS